MHKVLASLLSLPFLLQGSDKLRKMRLVFQAKGLAYYRQALSQAKKMQGFAFPDTLSVCAIVKNETAYLPEWIEYHKLQGVDRFYIYDNGSTDDIKGCLAPYTSTGLVQLIEYAGKGVQKQAYNDAILRTRDKTEWLAFIDIDEFIVPLTCKNIKDFLRRFTDEDIDQIAIFWLTYGSSGHKTKPDGLVIENFTHHATLPEHTVKSILKPCRTLLADVHSSSVLGRTVNEHKNPFSKKKASVDLIRINHYYGKSKEEFMVKRAKGMVVRTDDKLIDMTEFENHDKNDATDKVMLPFITPVKAALQKIKGSS